MNETDYLHFNKISWNKRTEVHFDSEFYDVKGFLEGKTSLQEIELALLGDIKGKTILHLQCHFGQDTLSLARMGAKVTGVDLSDIAIKRAEELAKLAGLEANFICSDIYDLPAKLDQQYDIVFTSYGTIGWLPDMNRWADVIRKHLKPGGKLIFVEFHPVVWMFDDDFKEVSYNYFNDGPIIETQTGTYTDRNADIQTKDVMWNHGIAEVINALIHNGLSLDDLQEYDYSPYPCFKHVEEFKAKKYRIQHLKNNIPMVYSVVAIKK